MKTVRIDHVPPCSVFYIVPTCSCIFGQTRKWYEIQDIKYKFGTKAVLFFFQTNLAIYVSQNTSSFFKLQMDYIKALSIPGTELHEGSDLCAIQERSSHASLGYESQNQSSPCALLNREISGVEVDVCTDVARMHTIYA